MRTHARQNTPTNLAHTHMAETNTHSPDTYTHEADTHTHAKPTPTRTQGQHVHGQGRHIYAQGLQEMCKSDSNQTPKTVKKLNTSRAE